MRKKHEEENVSRVLNFANRLLVEISAITQWVSISAFASSVGIPKRTTNSAIGLQICVITAWIKKYKSTIKKKNKQHDKIVLLAKYKLTSIEVLISKPLFDSNFIHDEFILINNVLKIMSCFMMRKKKPNILINHI